MAGPEDEPQEIEIHIDPANLAGVWANFARVSHSRHEFTLDFVRMDQTQNPPMGIVVARVSVSPLFITQLITTLQTNWEQFAKKAMPQEVHGNEHDEPDEN